MIFYSGNLEHKQERHKMDKISIAKITPNIFKPQSTENKQSAHSNPFGINFKGNVLAADVFESSKPKETVSSTNPFAQASEKSKLFASAIVGGINSFNNAFKSRMNAIVSFGRQIKENIAQSWEKAKNTEITFDFNALTESIANKFNNPYSVTNLTKRPVTDLEMMLKEELSA